MNIDEPVGVLQTGLWRGTQGSTEEVEADELSEISTFIFNDLNADLTIYLEDKQSKLLSVTFILESRGGHVFNLRLLPPQCLHLFTTIIRNPVITLLQLP